MTVQRTTPRPTSPRPVERADGYTVKPGDTLSGIARRHGVGLHDLIRANPQIRDPNLIRAGQPIQIPSSSSSATPAERQAVDPSRQGASRRRAVGAERQVTNRVGADEAASPDARRAFNAEIARLNGAVARGVPGARDALAALRRDRDGVMGAIATVEKKLATTTDPAARAQLDKERSDLQAFGVKVARMSPRERQDLQNFFRLQREDPAAFNRFVASQGPQATAPASRTPTTATSPTAPVTPTPTGAPANIQAAIDFGMSQLGAPYVGGASPFRFGTPGDGRTYQMQGQRAYVSPRGVVGYDCSGLMVTMLQKAGIDIRAFGSSRAMKSGIPQIPKDQLRPGDLLVKNGHVAMYTGNGQMIEATPNGGVKVGPASTYINNPDYSAHRPG